MKRIETGILLLALACCLQTRARAERPPSPFEVTATLITNARSPVVHFDFQIPPRHHIYASRLHFQNEDGKALEPFSPREAEKGPVAPDKMYHESFGADFKLEGALPMNLVVKFQGCSNTACYFPEKRMFRVTTEGVTLLNAVAPPSGSEAAETPLAPAQNWR